jgi:CHAT domain-containing protein
MPDETGVPIPEQVLDYLARQSPVELQDLLRPDVQMFRPEAVEQLAEAVRSSLRVDVGRALNLAEAAVLIATKLGDGRSMGLSLRSKGNALWFKNELTAASELFTAALGHFEEAGLSDEVGRTLSSSIQALVLMGEYERAFTAAERAREIFQNSGDERRLARLEINIANLHHRQDRFPEALACYRSAYMKLLPYKDAEGIGVALHNMAVCLIMLDDFQAALDTFRDAQKICEKHSMPLLALQADYNVSYLYFLRGEYKKALHGLRQVREKCRKNGDSYHEALCHLDESEILLELNLTRPAAQMADQAADRFAKLNMPFEQGRALANFAVASHRLSDSTKALELFVSAREIFSKEGNEAWVALIALYESIVLLESGQLKDARRSCRSAKTFFSSAGLERREALADLVLVRILFSSGELASAASLCGKTQRRLARINAPLLEFQAHLLMGRIEQSSGRSDEAYASFERARLQLETLRSWVQGDELKVAFMRDKAELYAHLVQLCMRTGQGFSQAFAHMEQAKSRALADLVNGRSSAGVGGARTNLADQSALDALRSELNWYYHRLELEQNPKEHIASARIRQLHSKIQVREDDFLRALREVEPQGTTAGERGGAGESITLSEVRSFLGSDTTLIEYFQIENSFVAAVVSLDSIQIVPLAGVAEVAESLQMLEFQMSRMRVPGFSAGISVERLTELAASRLRDLYKQVFAPLSSYVKTEECIIVPHGMLHYVPFHALATGGDYLIDRLALSYAPSASLYAACAGRAVNSAGPSLLLGVPDAKAPDIQQEIESIAAVAPDPKVFVGADATSGVLRTEGAKARIIHMGTHGVARHDNPLFSTIRLADRYLTLHDFYQLTLPAQLITLSGCATGVSAIAAGDEIQGLTRGLLHAGASSVVVTLWDVQDHTTAEFMRLLYSKLFANGDKARVMQETMVTFRRQYPHPFHWAPFTIVGSRARISK